MKYRVLYIKKSGLISWYEVETIQACLEIAKNEKQEVDVYECLNNGVCKYLMSIEVL